MLDSDARQEALRHRWQMQAHKKAAGEVPRIAGEPAERQMATATFHLHAATAYENYADARNPEVRDEYLRSARETGARAWRMTEQYPV